MLKMKIKHKIATGLIKRYMLFMGYLGWTSFWNTIYYIDQASLKNEELKRHELKHIEQMKRDGKLKFTNKYLWYSLRFGYKNNPYEVEARKAEKEENTTKCPKCSGVLKCKSISNTHHYFYQECSSCNEVFPDK
jgi:hypothetical protein